MSKIDELPIVYVDSAKKQGSRATVKAAEAKPWKNVFLLTLITIQLSLLGYQHIIRPSVLLNAYYFLSLEFI